MQSETPAPQASTAAASEQEAATLNLPDFSLPLGARPTALQSIVTDVARVLKSQTTRIAGTVTDIDRTHYIVSGFGSNARLGDLVLLKDGENEAEGEVIRLQPDRATIKPYGPIEFTRLGDRAWLSGQIEVRPTLAWKGRTVNALAQPIDGGGELPQGDASYTRDRAPPPPLELEKVSEPLTTGVRAIDLFTPLCSGQRIGVFAGSGVGKSSLLAMLSQGKNFDSVVLGLVGERGREVRHFLDDVFGSHKDRTTAVVASGAESAMLRRLAPYTAMCIAEYLRDQGERVLLVLDSLTRFAHASREVGLAAGEPPVSRGYPPSVFSDLPRLLERAGAGQNGQGSITGIFSVLIDGDDHNDPVADSIRGILDGHIVLDREIADQGRYPAINMLSSISRLAAHSWTDAQRDLITKLKSLISRFEDSRDLRAVGAYQPGSDLELDDAVRIVPKVYEALKQRPGEPVADDAFAELAKRLAPQQEN